MSKPRPLNEPYCGHCGYALRGLSESSRCPECGHPIVDVLVRDGFPAQRGLRYQSSVRWFGLPVLSVASGPTATERIGRPRGIIAIGDMPVGVIAIGGFARGFLAVGGSALGVITIGGFSAGVLAAGGVAIGGGAVGGLAIGVYAFGGMAAYVLKGFGGFSVPLRFW